MVDVLTFKICFVPMLVLRFKGWKVVVVGAGFLDERIELCVCHDHTSRIICT